MSEAVAVRRADRVEDRAEGRDGRLELTFSPGAAGTWLSRQASVAPLRVHRPFPLGNGEVVTQVVHVGPGLLAGDRTTIEVHVRSGAAAALVTQSATKVHRMDPGEAARQSVHVRVESGARLEVHAGLVIPFPGATFDQTVEVELQPGADFAWIERWTTGRAGDDPRDGYRRLASRLRLRVDGRLRYADALALEGGPNDLRPGLLDGRRALATGVFVGSTPMQERDGHDGVAVGAFDPDLGGWYLRASHDDPWTLRRAVQDVNDRRRTDAGRPRLDVDRYGS